MPSQIPRDFRRVIIAASLGNVIEWYDFYIFGSLAAVLSVKFFAKGHPVAALLSTIALFTAGFLIRPLGAFLFGWLGDRVGRKYTFLITLSGMGLGTGAIGLIPTFEFDRLDRCIPPLRPADDPRFVPGRRVWRGDHICRRACPGRTPRLLHRLAADFSDPRDRGVAGRDHRCTLVFRRSGIRQWAWRIPFLLSFLLVAIAIYIRLQLQETPIFQEIKARGQMARNPWKEAFLTANVKFVLIACIVVIGEGVVWYSSQFWALYFLQQVSKVDPLTTAYIVGAALLIASPTLILFGWLSDLIGRKPVILGGFLLAAVTYYPLYSWLGTVTQPGQINYPVAVFIIFILVSYVGMVYGPIGAFLAEYFPSRIRYTSVSVPYHIGNGWGGGLVPFITSAAFLATGSLGNALIYPIAVPAVCFIVCLFLMPETRKISIWEPTEVRPAS